MFGMSIKRCVSYGLNCFSLYVGPICVVSILLIKYMSCVRDIVLCANLLSNHWFGLCFAASQTEIVIKTRA